MFLQFIIVEFMPPIILPYTPLPLLGSDEINAMLLVPALYVSEALVLRAYETLPFSYNQRNNHRNQHFGIRPGLM
jgi:hypothetical protein